MKRIVFFLCICLLSCIGFQRVGASASAFPLTQDNVESEVGQSYSATLKVSLCSNDGLGSWMYQDSISFTDDLTNEIVESFFTNVKPLPTGLSVQGFELSNPYDFDQDPSGEYDNTQLLISIAGTISDTFNVSGYEDDYIEMKIDHNYLNNCEEDLLLHPELVEQPMLLMANNNTNFSTGKYKIGATKYTVSYDCQGIGIAPNSESVQKGFKASDPGQLSADGYIFHGWYLESACNNEYDFDERVLNDFTLYAKWSRVENNVEEPIVETPSFVAPKTGID